MNKRGEQPNPDSPADPVGTGGLHDTRPIRHSDKADAMDLDKVADVLAFFDQVRNHIHSDEEESVDVAADPTLPVSGSRQPIETVESDPQLPANVGRFEIMGVLGQGGFARVFLAHDPKLSRNVALKVLKPSAVASDESRQRFQREAHAAAILAHPNIVPVFESGSVGIMHFLVSEYCDGVTLGQWFEERNRTVAPTIAADVVARLAEAVQHAHQRGVVHRDLKPGNILLQSNDETDDLVDRLRITDFGLARFSDLDSQTLTTDGAIIGTPAYMSPEQARGEIEIGPTTDVFSLGIVLYEMLTGKLPFRGENHISTLRLVEQADPATPRRMNAEIPKDIEAICLKCLAKEPDDRYATAYDLALDLKNWTGGLPVTARTARSHEKAWRWCQRNSGLAAALTLAFTSLVVGFSLTTWKWLEADRNRLSAELATKRANVEARNARNAELAAKEETARANKLSKRTNDALEAFKYAFMAPDPNRQGNVNMTARDVLEAASSYLPASDFDDQGKLIFYDALFGSYAGIGDLHQAEKIGKQRLETTGRVYGENSIEELSARSQYARLLTRMSRFSDAHDILTAVLEEQLKTAPESPSRYWSQFEVGRIKFSMGDIVHSIEPMQSGLDGFVQAAGNDVRAFADATDMAVVLGEAYLDLEQLEPAERLLIQAYEDSRTRDSQENSISLRAKEALVRLHEFNGEMELAKTMQDEVRKVRNEKYGRDHPNSLASNTFAARQLVSEGKLEEAKTIADDVVARARKHLGEEHRTTLMAMMQQARVLAKLEEFDSAIEILNESQRKWIANYPDEKRTQRNTRNELGNVYLKKGQKTAETGLIKTALAKFDKNIDELNGVLPDHHSQVLFAENGRIQALFMLKEYSAAEAEAVDFLAKVKRKYRNDHRNVLTATDLLASCYTELDRVDDAIKMFEEVVAIRKSTLPETHPASISAMLKFGMQLNAKKRFKDAETVLSKATELASDVPDETFLVNGTRTALGMALHGNGKLDDAIDVLEKVVSETLNDPRLQSASDTLRRCYLEKNQVDDYLRITEINMRVTKTMTGTNELTYSQHQLNVAKEMLKLKLHEKAIEYYRESSETRTRLDPNAWYTFNAKSLLGGALVEAGRFDEARPILETAHRGTVASQEQVPMNAGTKSVRSSIERLIKLAKAENNPEETERWKNELASIADAGEK